MQAKYDIEPKNTVLLGFSQGGIMAYAVGLTESETICKIIVIGGRLLVETSAKIKSEKRVNCLQKEALKPPP